MNSASALPGSYGSPARLVAAILFGLAAYAALAGAAAYTSAVLFLLLNQADPSQARLTSLPHYWRLYAGDALLRKKLQVSLGIAGGGLLVVLPIAAIAGTRKPRPLHGDARFANAAEVKRAGLLDGDPPGILVGRYRGRFLSLPGQRSVMLSAPTRGGKGVSVVIPNLLNWPDSVVALDIKGENFALTAGYRAARGQPVFAFSPFDEDARSHRWNPLTAVRADALHRIGDLLAIGQVFYPNDGSSTSSEAFFNDQARNLFMGLGLLLLETPALPRTLGEMLRQASGKGQSLRAHLGSRIREGAQAGRALSDDCIDALQRLLSNSDNTMTSIVATFTAPLIIFADTVVDAATSGDDFRLEDLRRQRMAIYVRIPPHRLAPARPLLALFFSQLVNLNTQHLPEQDACLKFQCLLVHDEFAALGRVPVITQSAAFLAGYNLRLLTVIQAMSQLDSVYGDKEARTFATNHGLQILFAPREQRDAEDYSAMLGHFTEQGISRGRSRSFGGQGHTSISSNESDQRRALLLPQEFKELGSERLVVILENCKPILAEKIRYYRDRAFKNRLLPPPEVAPMDIELHLARVQQRWRVLDEVLAPGETLTADRLAHDLSRVPDPLPADNAAVASTLLEVFGSEDPEAAGDGGGGGGGTVEALPDEDGVLAAELDPAQQPGIDLPEPLRH